MAANSDQTLWEHRWETIAKATRRMLLSTFHVQVYYYETQGVPASRMNESERREALDNHFIKSSGGREERFSLTKESQTFLERVQNAQRMRALVMKKEEFENSYFWGGRSDGQLPARRNKVLAQARMPPESDVRALMRNYVGTRDWPDWVLATLKMPLATRLYAALEAQPEPVALASVPGLLPDEDADAVRVALRDLTDLLAVFEDVDAESWRLVVGIPQPVRKARKKPVPARREIPLEAVAAPALSAPSTGYLVDDIRAALNELAVEPARVRQDRGVYQKEFARFEQRLEPIAKELLPEALHALAKRAEEALGWAVGMGLTRYEKRDNGECLALSPAGHDWLSATLANQYHAVYKHLRAQANRPAGYGWYYGPSDAYFTGGDAVVRAVKAKTTTPSSLKLTDDERDGLRDGLLRSLQLLPVDGWVRQANFVAHVTQGPNTPFPVPKPPFTRLLFHRNQYVPPLHEQHARIAAQALELMIDQRLVPLGCVQLGANELGEPVIKRTPRLEAYFGKKVDPADMGEVAQEGSRVIVQPDFTVLIIGTNAAAAADLIAFSERVVGAHYTPGTTQLKITRTSVMRAAVQTNLAGAEMVRRLQEHSSVPVPSNVQHELREWTANVRQVTYAARLVFACPDAPTAQRIRAALGAKAELLTDTLVAFAGHDLQPALRKKLQAEGVNVRPGPLTAAAQSAKKTSQGAKRKKKAPPAES